MITHKFREVMAFADAVTVLRRGKLAGDGRGRASSRPTRWRAMMVGAEELTVQPPRTRRMPARPRLEIEASRCARRRRRMRPCTTSRSPIRAGEIVGIAGVSGNGQRELVEVLAGQREADGRRDPRRMASPITPRARRCAATSVAACRRSRCATPASPRMSVAENMALRNFDRPPFASGGWWLNRGAVPRTPRSA